MKSTVACMRRENVCEALQINVGHARMQFESEGGKQCAVVSMLRELWFP